MNKIIPIILISGGLLLGFIGYDKLDDHSVSVEMGDLEISTEKKSETSIGYLLMGLSTICLVGGMARVGRRKIA